MVSAQIKPQPASTDTYPAPLVLRLPGGWALTDDCIIQLGALNNATVVRTHRRRSTPDLILHPAGKVKPTRI